MVYQQFRVYAEQFIEQFFVVIALTVSDRASCDIAHREHTMFGQFFGITMTDPPEVGNRPVVPQKTAVTHLIKFRNTDAVFIRRGMFGHNIHGDLAQIQICAKTRRGRDAGLGKNVLYDLAGQFSCGQRIGIKVCGYVHKDFINRVNMNIFRSNVFQVNFIYFGAVFHIMRHTGRGDDIGEGKLRVFR